jgi:hypothetical protein
MKPQTIGRALGIGLRIAGRIASQSMAASVQSTIAVPTAQANGGAQVRGVADKRAAGRATGGVAHGVGGFLRPFRRVGGILWLEVTGVFFFLFVLIFAQNLWRIRESWVHGENRPKFMVFAAMMAVFLYLSVSSFWRARKR